MPAAASWQLGSGSCVALAKVGQGLPEAAGAEHAMVASCSFPLFRLAKSLRSRVGPLRELVAGPAFMLAVWLARWSASSSHPLKLRVCSAAGVVMPASADLGLAGSCR